MKLILSIPSVALLATMLPSCTNTIFLGHDHAYDVNLDLGADITKVVAINAGVESRSYAAVPPQGSLKPKDLGNPELMGSGDALSTLSSLKVERVSDGAGSIDYIIATATGETAVEIAKSLGKTQAVPPPDAVNPIAAAAKKVTNPE